MDVFNKQSLICASNLEREIDTHDRELNIFPLITKSALDIICSKLMYISIFWQLHMIRKIIIVNLVCNTYLLNLHVIL